MNALILSLLLIGHTAIWVTFVNRSHGIPLGKKRLRSLRHIHDVMLFLGPAAILWFVGFTGPRILLGGSWQNVNFFWRCVLAICAGGLAWLLYVIARGFLRPWPRSLVSNHSTCHNIASDLGRIPVAPGPYNFLARVPLNEQFQLQFNEKTLKLKSLPAAWDGLTILHISDWHFQGTVTKDYFVRAAQIAAQQPVDLVCFTGDLIDNLDLLDWIPDTLGQLHGRLGQCFILGNHDWYQDQQQVRSALVNMGWRDVRHAPLHLERGRAWLDIVGDETPWMGQHPCLIGDWEQRDPNVKFRIAPGKTLADNEPAVFHILLSHTPDNIAWARRHRVDLMLSGHNHGGQIQLPVIGPVYSPSLYGCKYAAGTFDESPTLLHVSRGLSGEHPLRWRCLPEITRLILKSTGEPMGASPGSPSE